MIRIIGYAERNVASDPPSVIGVGASAATEVFPNQRLTRGEIAHRYVQNLTGARLFLSVNLSAANGVDPQCDDVGMFHHMLEDGQLFDFSDSRERVCCYSVAGGPISTRVVRRHDLTHNITPP